MNFLSDLIVKIEILEISNINFRAILILALIWLGKYFIKTIFDTKIETDIFEAFLILGPIWAKQVVNIS